MNNATKLSPLAKFADKATTNSKGKTTSFMVLGVFMLAVSIFNMVVGQDAISASLFMAAATLFFISSGFIELIYKKYKQD